MVNSFDYIIIHFINQFCQRHEIFDKTIVFLVDNDLFKGGVIMILFWWVWFSPAKDLSVKRQGIISTFYGCFAALFISRVITRFIQYRTRPILNPDNHLLMASGFDLSRIPDTHN